MIDKPLGLSLLYNGKCLQSVVPGKNITMESVLDDFAMDPHVLNIKISAGLSNYYTPTYLDDWVNADLSVLGNNFSNYYDETYLDNQFTGLVSVDYLNLKIY